MAFLRQFIPMGFGRELYLRIALIRTTVAPTNYGCRLLLQERKVDRAGMKIIWNVLFLNLVKSTLCIHYKTYNSGLSPRKNLGYTFRSRHTTPNPQLPSTQYPTTP